MRDLSMHVLDIVQNSIKAEAKLITVLFVKSADNTLTFTVKGDGCGMSPEFLAKVTDPFTTTRTTRKVGMGLPLFKLAAEQTGGTFSLTSRQALREGGIPFEISLNQPNKETIAAMLEAERIAKDPSVKGYTDLDELFADLKA